jgi:hypothetical protein
MTWFFKQSPAAALRAAAAGLALAAALIALPATGHAGSVFLTGHDPDFHALLGANALGAQHINQDAISYIMDPSFNPYKSGGVNKFLFVESSISPPAGHVDGLGGLVASGYVNGVDFERHDAASLNSELNLLGTKYAGVVVASDFGGILTQAELNILDARSADLITFLNNGGGLYAMAEADGGAGLTPGGGHFGFLPFIVTENALDQAETGFTVTAYGAGLGLTANDINGNASHNVFTGTGGMNVVDNDAAGNILSLASRNKVTVGGVVPEPNPGFLLAFGLASLAALRLRRQG